jgi:hypothetical protein
MDKQLVTVTRKWHEPFIRVDVTEVGIGITMTYEDFVTAMSMELGLPVSVVLSAAERVVDGMKRESARVM